MRERTNIQKLIPIQESLYSLLNHWKKSLSLHSEISDILKENFRDFDNRIERDEVSQLLEKWVEEGDEYGFESYIGEEVVESDESMEVSEEDSDVEMECDYEE